MSSIGTRVHPTVSLCGVCDHCWVGDGVFDVDGQTFVPRAIGAGPWSSRAMHGGPPAALVGRMLDEWDDNNGAWRLTRLSVELLRPVPVAPLRVRVEPRRQGRRIQVLDAALRDESGTEVIVARGLRVAVADTASTRNRSRLLIQLQLLILTGVSGGVATAVARAGTRSPMRWMCVSSRVDHSTSWVQLMSGSA